MRNMKKSVMVLVVCLISMALSGWVSAGEPVKERVAKGGMIKKIDLNTASVEELSELERIGVKTAQKIVAYREKNGPFKSPEDIMKVEGIGTVTYEINKERITVGKSPSLSKRN